MSSLDTIVDTTQSNKDDEKANTAADTVTTSGIDTEDDSNVTAQVNDIVQDASKGEAFVPTPQVHEQIVTTTALLREKETNEKNANALRQDATEAIDKAKTAVRSANNALAESKEVERKAENESDNLTQIIQDSVAQQKRQVKAATGARASEVAKKKAMVEKVTVQALLDPVSIDMEANYEAVCAGFFQNPNGTRVLAVCRKTEDDSCPVRYDAARCTPLAPVSANVSTSAAKLMW